MSNISLSVIIPTRNANEQLLARAVQSAKVLGAEVCVWYDHYDTEDWIDSHWDKVRNGRIFKNLQVDCGRRGQVGAMNGALAMAKRKYILFHGDDDFVGDGAIELCRYLDEHPEIEFAYGSQQYIGLRTDLVKARQYVGDELYQHNIPLNAIVYRRDIVMDLGGYRETHNIEGAGHCEDYDLLLRAHEAGCVGHAVDTVAPVLHYTLAHGRGWHTMQAHADAINTAFKALHPKFTGRL